MEEVLHKIMADPRYTRGMKYGVPRPGHLEGSVENHVLDLETNLKKLCLAEPPMISLEEAQKLKILIHVHDTFKVVATPNSAIIDSRSHASLARNFLSEFTDDRDLLQMVQYHDEGVALWESFVERGKYRKSRLMDRVIAGIQDLDLYLIFTILDGYTPSKDHKKIRWFIDQVNLYVPTPRAYKVLELFGV